MATIGVLGTATFNTNSGTKTVTTTPALSDLIILITCHTGNTSAAAATDNNAGGGGTYTQIAECASVKASSADTMRVWIRDYPILSATSTTFSHAPGTTSGGGLVVVAAQGILRFGGNACRQGAKQDNQAGGGTPTPVLAAAALTGNPMVAVIFNATNPPALTPRASWTGEGSVGYATPTTGAQIMTIDSGETASSIAWGSTSASAFCSTVLELNALAPLPILNMSPMLPPRRFR